MSDSLEDKQEVKIYIGAPLNYKTEEYLILPEEEAWKLYTRLSKILREYGEPHTKSYLIDREKNTR